MKISVCMATYNGEKYILEQVKSILEQINANDELIISDDGSTDDTLKILVGLNDSRIKIYKNKGEHGYTANFENALKFASGDLIFLSDQDDIWCKDKVKVILEKMEKDKYDFIIHDCKMVDSQLNIISESRFKELNVKSGFIAQMIRMRYLGCCMAFNRKMLITMLPFPKNKKLVEHDTWIATFGELYYKTCMLNEKLILYRRHDGNVSDAGVGKGYPIKIKILRRIYRLIWLLYKFPKVVKSKLNKEKL